MSCLFYVPAKFCTIVVLFELGESRLEDEVAKFQCRLSALQIWDGRKCGGLFSGVCLESSLV